VPKAEFFVSQSGMFLYNLAMKLLFWSTPLGYLGSGGGGGVELTLLNLAQELSRRGHAITIVAPQGSAPAIAAIAPPPGDRPGSLPPIAVEVAGVPPVSAQHQDRQTPALIPPQSILAAMGEQVRRLQDRHDLIVNFAYDWLPFYLTPFLQRSVAHVVSMGSLGDLMDETIGQVLDRYPGTIAVHSQAQAATFPFGDRCHCIGNGLDLSRYTFNPQPQPWLGWVGRITPEKGLEDALAAAQQCQIPLKVWGALESPEYWQALQAQYPDAPVTYGGFLPTEELQRQLGQCSGLLMTPRWVEAFGNVVVEALACGVPVVAYRRGGPQEIVKSGVTGWLVEPDSVAGLVEAIGKLGAIDRQACRHHAESTYGLAAWGDRVEAWLMKLNPFEPK